MKGYLKLTVALVVILAVLCAGANIALYKEYKGDQGRPYRVEAERIAEKIARGEAYSLEEYQYIKGVRETEGGFREGNRDYLVKEINGKLYRFDYAYQVDPAGVRKTFTLCFGMVAAFVLLLLLFLFFRIIRPFESIKNYPKELAKGNLTVPLKENKGRFFGEFLWGMDLLRETLEARKAEELALKKQKKTMVLSLSHDIKTPLGVIELYARALEKGLYKDEERKLEVARSIHDKCEEIRSYVDDIIKTSSEEFLSLEVNNGEFYLSELIRRIREFYTDKLALVKTEYVIDSFSDRLLSGDLERSVEVVQNIIENAVKYGDGGEIALSFSKEDDCQLIHIRSTGCTLDEKELPNIFDSFWRGSNVGRNSGSGLGLYICRALMHKMNGDIFATIRDGALIVTLVFL